MTHCSCGVQSRHEDWICVRCKGCMFQSSTTLHCGQHCTCALSGSLLYIFQLSDCLTAFAFNKLAWGFLNLNATWYRQFQVATYCMYEIQNDFQSFISIYQLKFCLVCEFFLKCIVNRMLHWWQFIMEHNKINLTQKYEIVCFRLLLRY